jgi:hypothetical protein
VHELAAFEGMPAYPENELRKGCIPHPVFITSPNDFSGFFDSVKRFFIPFEEIDIYH